MRRGICPKCGGNDIRQAMADARTFGQGEWILSGAGFRFSHHVYTHATVLVCLYCGYLEEYILDPRALQEAAQKWPRVQPQYPPGGGQQG